MSISVQNVNFTYEEKLLLNGVSFDVNPGEIVTLIGSSGSGKTTILQLLNGLISAESGTLDVAGTPIPAGSRNVSYMMQDPMLLPWRTAWRNITLPCELGREKVEVQHQAHRLLQELKLEGFENYHPHELSGGMQQRVALGRTLIQEKPVLLLDEPFSSLDVILREQLYALLRKIRDRLGTTILMVTHDFRDALSLSDRILLLKEGMIQQEWKTSSHTQPILSEMRQALI